MRDVDGAAAPSTAPRAVPHPGTHLSRGVHQGSPMYMHQWSPMYMHQWSPTHMHQWSPMYMHQWYMHQWSPTWSPLYMHQWSPMYMHQWSVGHLRTPARPVGHPMHTHCTVSHLLAVAACTASHLAPVGSSCLYCLLPSTCWQ